MDNPTKPATCHKCHSPSNKLFLCACTSCKLLFHFTCVPDRKNAFDVVICHECLAFKTQPRLLPCLKKESELLRNELKKSDELIKLYRMQAEECTALVEGLLRGDDEEGEMEGENDNANSQ
jgi:hypothetical protein